MHYAWNPDDYPADKIDQYMVDWARSIFGGEYAREIADIVTEYSKMNLERKPEVQRARARVVLKCAFIKLHTHTDVKNLTQDDIPSVVRGNYSK